MHYLTFIKNYMVIKNREVILCKQKKKNTNLLFSFTDIAIHHSNTVDESMKAVLSVPLNFSTEVRKSVWKAAEKAGFNVLQVISEPAAALLSYGIGQANKHEAL